VDQHVAGVPIDMSPVSRGKGLGSVSSGQQGHTPRSPCTGSRLRPGKAPPGSVVMERIETCLTRQ
jgi:hypothetical protein